MAPPYTITFKRITDDVGPLTGGVKKNDVRNMNAYQIIPGIMYTLLARLKGVLQNSILNELDAKNAINYVIRYGYATRSLPFNTMRGACTKYGGQARVYLNQGKENDEAIPVTVMLVSMYNVYYTFQTDNRKNVFILALEGLEHTGGTISDKSLVCTISKLQS
jgi:hypothetical protein